MKESDRAILELEERHPERGDAKHEVVRRELGLSAVRYYQRLNHLVVLPGVVAEFPQTAARVQRENQRGRTLRPSDALSDAPDPIFGTPPGT